MSGKGPSPSSQGIIATTMTGRYRATSYDAQPPVVRRRLWQLVER